MRRQVSLLLVGLLTSFAYASSIPRGPANVKPATPAQPTVWCKCVAAPKDEADSNPFVFRIGRTGDNHKPLRVWITTGGTMTAGEDYVAPPHFVTIPAGKDEVDLKIQGIDDDLAEGVETLEVSVSMNQPADEAPPTTQAAAK